MKNAKEYLITEVSSDTDITKLTPNQISNIMESYAMYFYLHQSKLKNNVGLDDVVGQSEQLVICKKCGSSEMYQYTKTKDKCEDCGNIQDY